MGLLKEALVFAIFLFMLGAICAGVIIFLIASKIAYDNGSMLNMVACWLIAFGIVCFGGPITSRLMDRID